MERVNVHLTEPEIEALKVVSDFSGVPKAGLIRRAIDDYIEKKKIEGITGILGVFA